MASTDPHYNRKPVPDEFIEHVGYTGMSKQEEYLARERKLSKEKGDLRKFWNPLSKSGSLDPHYARKPVPDSMLEGVGDTGLSPEEEHLNREQKMYHNGVDLRRFSTSASGGMAPQNDPYYGRKPVAGAEIAGVGESGMSKAEEFETRENKAALFDLSGDPFQQLSGSGHRGSVSMVATAGAADARRRSSAVAPDTARATHNVHGDGSGSASSGSAMHSGYTGEKTALPEIDSGRNTFGETTVNDSAAQNQYNYGPTTTTTTTTTTTANTTSTGAGHNNQHGLYHDITTHDPDSVAPDERR